MADQTRKLTSYSFAVVIAAMLAVLAYVSYQGQFKQIAFIDFSQYSFYGKNDIFEAKHNHYVLLFYSSKQRSALDIIKSIKMRADAKIIALDLAQNRFENTKNISYITTSMNNILDIVQRFNVHKVPSLLYLDKVQQKIYRKNGILQEF